MFSLSRAYGWAAATMGVAVLMVAGCQATSPDSAEDVYLAEGGSWTIDPDSLCDRCWDEVDEIRDVFPEVEGIVEITDIGPTVFTMRGLRAGDTVVTIIGLDEGNDVVERYAHVIVRPVNRFNFGPRCDVRDPSEEALIVPPGSELYVHWMLYDTNYERLAGHPEFELAAIGAHELDVDNSDVTLQMPDTPGTTEITSPLYEGAVATVEVHVPGDFDGFEAVLWPETPVEIGKSRSIWSAMLVNGRRVCLDNEERYAEVLTPETCEFSNAATVAEFTGPDGRFYGVAEGLCTVRVSVPAYGFAETLSIDVVLPTDTDSQ